MKNLFFIISIVFISIMFFSCKEPINEYHLYKDEVFNKALNEIIVKFGKKDKYGDSVIDCLFTDKEENVYNLIFVTGAQNRERAGYIDGISNELIYVSKNNTYISLNDFVINIIKIKGKGPMYESLFDPRPSIYYWKINDHNSLYFDDINGYLTVKFNKKIEKIKIK